MRWFGVVIAAVNLALVATLLTIGGSISALGAVAMALWILGTEFQLLTLRKERDHD